MCAFQSRLFVPLYQINYEDVKMGEKIIRERAKLKWTQFGGGIFHPLISTVLKSFLEIRYCSQSSYTFSIFFFFIYISFFLSYSVLSLHFQSSRSFRIGYFSPRKNVPGITVCNDNSETTILSIAALEKRRFLFIFSLFFRLFLFFISIDYLELVVHYFLLRNVSLLHRCVLADIYIYSTD